MKRHICQALSVICCIFKAFLQIAVAFLVERLINITQANEKVASERNQVQYAVRESLLTPLRRPILIERQPLVRVPSFLFVLDAKRLVWLIRMTYLPFQSLPVRQGLCYMLSVSFFQENPACFYTLLSQVSQWRRERTLRYKQLSDRYLSLGAGLVMERGLQEYGLHEKDMQYRFGEYGKPVLLNYPTIHFNLSHSGQMVVGCFSDAEIGCDIEQIKEAHDIVSYCLVPEEIDFLRQQSAQSLRLYTFYRFWTLKESYLKLTGEGLNLPMKDLRVQLSDLDIRMERRKAEVPVFFQEFTFPGYCLSIAIKRKGRATFPADGYSALF